MPPGLLYHWNIRLFLDTLADKEPLCVHGLWCDGDKNFCSHQVEIYPRLIGVPVQAQAGKTPRQIIANMVEKNKNGRIM